MNRDDFILAAILMRRYVAAVETTLYWKMSTSEARKEIVEAERILALLEKEAEKFDE